MTSTQILALPVQANSRLLKASDNDLFYAIEAGESGADAKVISTDNDSINLALAEDEAASQDALGITKTSIVAFLGDSITAAASSATTSAAGVQSASFVGNGYPTWVRFALNARFEFLQKSSTFSDQTFGYSGYKINDIRGVLTADGTTVDYTNTTARIGYVVQRSNGPLAQLLSRSAGKDVLIVELSGANDIADPFVPAAPIAARRRALWEELIAGGIHPSKLVAVAILPRFTAFDAGLQTTQADNVNAINEADAAALGIKWIPYPAILKTAGVPTTGYFRDGLHPNTLGAKTLGEAVAVEIDDLISKSSIPIPMPSDAAWITANPYCTGSSAVSGSGYSGNIPTSWTAAANAAGNTAVYSKIVDANNQIAQRIVVTGSDRFGAFGLKVPLATQGIISGRKYRVVARIKGSGFSNISFYVIANLGTIAQTSQNSGFPAENSLDLTSFEGTLTTPIITTSNAANGSTMEIWCNFLGHGTVDIYQLGIVLVEDETIRSQSFDYYPKIQAAVSGTYTIKLTDSALYGIGGAGTINFVLPLAASAAGKTYKLKKTDATADIIRLSAQAGDNIEGVSSVDLTGQYQSITVTSNGATQWLKY